MSKELDRQEIARYSRHLVLPEVGMEGQLRLKEASILLVGAGGLGSPLGMYLAAAGIGRLGLVDFDVVDASNLQRQILYGTDDIGKSKLQVAAGRLRGLNPFLRVECHEIRLSRENALELLARYDIIIDGTDNFATRYLVNDACVLLGKPNVYGSILRFEGQASVFHSQDGPCYRCLFPDPPPPGSVPSCAEGGVLGVLPGIIGTIQATEAIKLVLGQGTSLVGRLLVFDALAMRFRELKLRKDPRCPVCGENPTITELLDYDELCGVPSPQTTAESDGHAVDAIFGEITARQLRERLDRGEKLTLVDVREPEEVAICRLEESVHIPLGEMARRFEELDSARPIVVHCKMGGRSSYAAEFLRSKGFLDVVNLAGGLDAWSDQIDPEMPRY